MLRKLQNWWQYENGKNITFSTVGVLIVAFFVLRGCGGNSSTEKTKSVEQTVNIDSIIATKKSGKVEEIETQPENVKRETQTQTQSFDEKMKSVEPQDYDKLRQNRLPLDKLMQEFAVDGLYSVHSQLGRLVEDLEKSHPDLTRREIIAIINTSFRDFAQIMKDSQYFNEKKAIIKGE